MELFIVGGQGTAAVVEVISAAQDFSVER